MESNKSWASNFLLYIQHTQNPMISPQIVEFIPISKVTVLLKIWEIIFLKHHMMENSIQMDWVDESNV